MPKKLLLCIVLSAFAAVAYSNPNTDAKSELKGKVVVVSDGDTISILDDEMKATKIRLYGIDTPERKQSFGTQAKKFTSKLCFGKNVSVKVHNKDRYGRTVGTVILPDGTNLNHLLVQNGFAWWYRYYAKNDKELEKLESEAKENKKGLWKEKDAVPPWQWRKLKKAERDKVAEKVADYRKAQQEEITRGMREQREARKKAIEKMLEERERTEKLYKEQELEYLKKKAAREQAYLDSQAVYVTKSGKKYHRESCKSLRKSKIKMTLAGTKGQYEPCKICKP